MSEAVKKSDIQQGDIFGDLAKEIKEASDELKRYDEQLKSVAKTYQEQLSKAEKLSISNLQTLNSLNEKSKKLVQEKQTTTKNLNVVDQERLKLEKAIAKERAAVSLANSKENKELQQLRAEKNKINKTIRDEIKQVDRNKNAYTKLSDESRNLKNESKRLGAEMIALEAKGGKNTKEWRNLERQYRKTTTSAKATDKQLKRLDSSVGDNQRSVGNYRKSLAGLNSTLARFGVVLGFGTVLRSSISMLSEFDEKVADIQKTTGLSTKAARGLSQELLKIDTRTSITNLQELASAAGRLGIQGTQNVIDFAQAADKVFVALGDDLEGTAEEIATNLGKISSLFGLESEFGVGEGIERVGSALNELSASSKANAGNIQDFTNRLAGLAGVLEVEDVTALGALFDEAGQSMEVASSTILKLLPELSKDFERFAEVAGMPAEEFKSIAENSPIEALKLVAEGAKNNEKGLFNLTATLESYGIESARASGIVATLTNNTERLTELQAISSKAIQENTSITDEFNTKNQTLTAVYEKLVNRVKAYVLGSEGATKVSEGLKSALAFLGRNLDTIVTVVGKAIRAFIIFKTAMAAMRLADQVRGWREAGGAIGSLTKNLTSGAAGAKKFDMALKGIGLSLAIELALEMASALWEIVEASNAAKNAEEERARRAELIEARKARGQLLSSGIESKALKDLQELRNTLDLQLAQGSITQTKYNEALKEGLELTLEGTEQEAKQMLQRGLYTGQLKALSEAQKEINKLQNNPALKESLDNEIKKRFRLAMAKKTEALAAIEGMDAQIEAMKVFRDSLRQQIIDLDINTAGTKRSAKESKKDAAATRDQTKALEDQTKALEEWTEAEQAASELRNAELEKSRRDEELAQENDLISQRLTERLTLINDYERLEKISAEEATEQRIIAEIDALNERKKLLEAYGEDTIQVENEISERTLELSKLGNEELTKDQKDAQNELFDIVNQVQRNISAIIERETDRRIAALNRELEAQRSLRDQLTQLAAEGNIDAQQSIKATIEAEREKEAEIARLEERKQKIQLISQGLETYISLLENGESPGSAFAQTVITTQGLISFLSGLQGFWTGTNYAPEGLAWTQEKGAEIITDKHGNIKSLGSGEGAQLTYLNQGDKVKTASETANIFRSFSEVENLRTIPKNDSAGSSYDLMTLGSKLDKIESAVKNQPHSHTDWENITRGLGAINNRTVRGGDVTVSKHYVKR